MTEPAGEVWLDLTGRVNGLAGSVVRYPPRSADLQMACGLTP